TAGDPVALGLVASLPRLRAGALVISSDPFFNSYGNSFADAHREVGVYTGRILKGEKPADLPIQQSVKAELVINLNTAKALGITVPLPLSGRADEVFE